MNLDSIFDILPEKWLSDYQNHSVQKPTGLFADLASGRNGSFFPQISDIWAKPSHYICCSFFTNTEGWRCVPVYVRLHLVFIPSYHIMRQCSTFWLARVYKSYQSRTDTFRATTEQQGRNFEREFSQVLFRGYRYLFCSCYYYYNKETKTQ